MPGNNHSAPGFIIYFNRTKIPPERAAEVKKIIIIDRLNSHSIFLIKVADIENEWSENDDYFIGSEVEILMGYQGNFESIITGDVIGLNCHMKRNQANEVTIKGNNYMHRLKRCITNKAFYDMTVKDIIADIADRAGLKSEVDELTYKHVFTLQNAKTDYEYLFHLADYYDCYFRVDKKTLYFKRLKQNMAEDVILEYGKTLLEFLPESDTSRIVSGVEVKAWNPAKHEAISTIATFSDIDSKGGAVIDDTFGGAEELRLDPQVLDQKTADQRAIALDLWTSGVPVNLTHLKSRSLKQKQHNKQDKSYPFFYRKKEIKFSPIVNDLPVTGKSIHIMKKPPELALATRGVSFDSDYIKKKPIKDPASITELVVSIQHSTAKMHQEYLSEQLKAYQLFMDGINKSVNILLNNDEEDFGIQENTGNISTNPVIPNTAPVLTKIKKTGAAAPKESPGGPVYNRADLEVLASGKISSVFGKEFEGQDDFKIQVRLPEPPLLLCDRVTGIKAKPKSMGIGTIWTETDVSKNSWYLHNGRMPGGIFIEAGQADLLLISYLGIDFLNQGKRAYRLLGCELNFMGELPKAGETLRYEIHVDRHVQNGDVRLFFFHYDCYVNGKCRISVRNGHAGFFTKNELVNSEGILWSPGECKYSLSAIIVPETVTPKRSFSAQEVLSYINGDMTSCFGEGFKLTQTHSRTPVSQKGDMNFIREVNVFDPYGGFKKRGYLKSVSKVTPDDWYFKGHFKNDPCMPGTLMAEGCLQMMSFYLVALGVTCNKDGWRFEPVTETNYKFLCRGQVTPDSHELIYELFVDEFIDKPYPTLFAHVLCTVDGTKAFLCERLGIKLVPDWPLTSMPDLLEVGNISGIPVAEYNGFKYDHKSLIHAALGRPSLAFGPDYKHYDDIIRCPRLPRQPYQFMNRIIKLDAVYGQTTGGPSITAQYDIPEDAWYFNENSSVTMPYCVLLEVGLQPCGWLSTFVFKDTVKGKELLFRNLDGEAVQHREVIPSDGIIETRTVLTSSSITQHTIIVSFDVECSINKELVYTMKTTFGFFESAAMKKQKGISISPEEQKNLTIEDNFYIELKDYPPKYFTGSTARLPMSKLLIIDNITGYIVSGGKRKLGYMRAEINVLSSDWWFKAHFFQDPVQPGSLGIEAILQLIEFYMINKDMHLDINNPGFEPVCIGARSEWHYRGQVTPDNNKVIIDIDILKEGSDEKGKFVFVEARLWVDGLKIYYIPEIGMRLVKKKHIWNLKETALANIKYLMKNIKPLNNNGLIIKFVENREELEECFKINRIVFIDELKLLDKIIEDEYVKTSLYLMFIKNGHIFGSLRLIFGDFTFLPYIKMPGAYSSDKSVELGRLAILKEYRKIRYTWEIIKYVNNHIFKGIQSLGYEAIIAPALFTEKHASFYKMLGLIYYREFYDPSNTVSGNKTGNNTILMGNTIDEIISINTKHIKALSQNCCVKRESKFRDWEIDIDVEDWIKDHRPTFTIPTLPLTYMVDMMAGAVSEMFPGMKLININNIRTNNWVPFENNIVTGKINLKKCGQSCALVELHMKKEAVDYFVKCVSGVFTFSPNYLVNQEPNIPILKNPEYQPDPYERGILFHGPKFQLMTSWQLGTKGSCCRVNNKKNRCPKGMINPILLDVATHCIPHDSFDHWCSVIPREVVAYPIGIDDFNFYKEIPKNENITVEARFLDFKADRFPVTRIFLKSENGELIASFKFIETILPKGPLGLAEPGKRRAFYTKEKFVKGVSLSCMADRKRIIRYEDVKKSNWLDGTVSSIYNIDRKTSLIGMAKEIALKEQAADELFLHPSDIIIKNGQCLNLPLNQFKLSYSVKENEIVVTPGVIKDIQFNEYDSDHSELSEKEKEIIKKFVRRIILKQPDSFSKLKRKPVMYLTDHRIGIESYLFLLLMRWLNEFPVMATLKKEYKESRPELIDKLREDLYGDKHPMGIHFFDREKPGDFFKFLSELKSGMNKNPISIVPPVLEYKWAV